MNGFQLTSNMKGLPGQYLQLSHKSQCGWELGFWLDGEWWEQFLGEDLCRDLTGIGFRCNSESGS
jgi:hypothetical protein